MQVGTNEEIQAQQAFVYKAERDLMKAKLRLRVLQGHALFHNGDSFNMQDLTTEMDELIREFGNRNIRLF